MGKKPKIIIDKLKDETINDIWKLFETKKEERKKNKHNDRMNKDQIIRDIRTKKGKEGRTKKKPNEKISKDSIIKNIRILFE